MIVGAAAAALLVTTATVPTGVLAASAKYATAVTGKAREDDPRPCKAITGTWMTTVTLSDAPPQVDQTFLALDTFLCDGPLLVSSSASNPSGRGLAHGEWIRTGNHHFASTFVWFRFDPSGKFVGMQRVRRTIELAANGDTFQSADVIEILDPAGNVVATFHGAEAGQRLQA